jgi:DNA-binding YbaB/EbfC family protein
MNIQQMMKQAQLMQQRMQELQAKLAVTEVTGQSGGGLVQVVMTCKGDVRKLEIAPEIINPGDKETLEDLVMAAINNARQNADQRLADDTRSMMEEFGLPPGAQLPGM